MKTGLSYKSAAEAQFMENADLAAYLGSFRTFSHSSTYHRSTKPHEAGLLL